jgi:hypothetical protein
MPLEPGQTATVERVVTRETTADASGSLGVTVLDRATAKTRGPG